jgi:hypothetical protein
MTPILCVECKAPLEATLWRVYRADDPRGDDWPEVAIYCPDCADREFGD